LRSRPNLDSLELVRDQLNSQRPLTVGVRFGQFRLAEALGADDRVRTPCFIGQLNGSKVFDVGRIWPGALWVSEYPDIANDAAPYSRFLRRPAFNNRREPVALIRKRRPKNWGVPQIMDFTRCRRRVRTFHLGWLGKRSAQVSLTSRRRFVRASAGNQQLVRPASGTDNAGLLAGVSEVEKP